MAWVHHFVRSRSVYRTQHCNKQNTRSCRLKYMRPEQLVRMRLQLVSPYTAVTYQGPMNKRAASASSSLLTCTTTMIHRSKRRSAMRKDSRRGAEGAVAEQYSSSVLRALRASARGCRCRGARASPPLSVANAHDDLARRD